MLFRSVVYQIKGTALTGGNGQAVRLFFEPGVHTLTLKNASTTTPVAFTLEFLEEVL